MLFGPRRVARVLFPLPLPEPFDYAVPDGVEARVGDHVTAPLSGRIARGVVWDLAEDDGARDLKALEDVLTAPPLPEVSRRFVDWVARYTVQPPGNVLRLALAGSSLWKPPSEETVFTPAPGETARITPGRRAVIEAAKAHPDGLSAKALADVAGVSEAVVRGLAKVGGLTPLRRPVPDPFGTPDPNRPGPDLAPAQAEAAAGLAQLLDQGGAQIALIDGVTGSGKTEVYLEAVAHLLRSEPDAQALVLLPEIALTQDIMARFEARFGAPPAQWHHEVGVGPKRRSWGGVAEGRARIVVGARSALFLPYSNLRLIVVDEEHDASFKQDEGAIYQARDMAVVRARLGGAVAALASATPSLESLVNAQRGRYAHLVLPARAGAATLPDVHLIDVRANRPGRDRWLTPPLVQAVTDTRARGEQTLLYLNRRGYAPLVVCRACGERMKAPDTDSWLVEHRYTGRLVCHLTGYSIPKPEKCPHCGEVDSLHPVGPGVERLEEETRALFPDARIQVFSSDTARDPAGVRGVVEAMAAGDIDILIGTQIAAKGHNFPGLTLVGVVDADLGLRGGDLRAAERTYQTLVQVSGRAGRADRPGRALVQTVMPEHEALQALAAGDRNRFLAVEIEERRMLGLPPFGRLAAFLVTARDEDRVAHLAKDIAKVAPRYDGVDVMGPAEPPVAVVRGWWRRRFLVRADLNVDLSAFMADWRAAAPNPSWARVHVDLDPYAAG